MPSSTRHIPILVAILLLLLVSCTSDGGSTEAEERVLVPTAGMAGSSQSSGRNFGQGDVVWAWADRYGTHDGYIKAWKLTATDVDGEFASPYKKLWPDDFSDLSIQAFHGNFDTPMEEGVTPLETLTHTISRDQTAVEDRDRSDLLYAILSPAHYKSRLTFMHMLSKIKIILKDTEEQGGVAEASITGADMKLQGVATTVRLDMETRQAVSTEPYADIVLGATTVEDHTAEAIFPPQRIDSGKPFFELTLHDFPRKDSVRTFRFTAPAEGITFESGKEYTYTLSVKNLISAKPVDIPVWEWENIENTLEWTKFFFSVIVMDWNGLSEYSHEWALVNFLPTVEEWEEMREYFQQWSWITPKPAVDDWYKAEKEGELPKNESGN